MDPLIYVQAFAALGVVLGLIWGGVWALRRYGSGFLKVPTASGGRQIRMLEQAALPHRKTMVRVRVGDEEHVLLLSQTSELLISTKPISPEADDD